MDRRNRRMHADQDLTPEIAGVLAVLHARHSAEIHHHLRRLLNDEEKVKVVARAVFARAREELIHGGRAPSSLRSWVLSLADQEALNRPDPGPEPARPAHFPEPIPPSASTQASSATRSEAAGSDQLTPQAE